LRHYNGLVVSLLKITCPSNIRVVIGQDPTLPENISKSYLAFGKFKAEDEHADIKIPIYPELALFIFNPVPSEANELERVI
jgi:hypothetical protein